ncbi:o-succinylbenzoate--CoA ligase [Psychromonas hadalis]|uniref:o-succinylbenzoate--CoA ligase n=1 Tax=Psychromonas hadalis TaxID=211669 RepID=UPI0003B4860A|nr:o-succinylbenzoate--CoA ligase [Psychromonas hadalis]
MQFELLDQCPVAWQAKLNPSLIAIETESQKITFAELHGYISHLSTQLIKLNMKTGDRLVSISSNNLPAVLLQLTCLRHGFVFCPLNPKFSPTELEQRLKRLNSPFIYQENSSSHLALSFSHATTVLANKQIFKIDPFAIISIIFTSGSSGLPKAVMHHFSNHYYSALGSQTVIPLDQGDKNLLSLPLFHISGYATVIRTLLAGATLKISNNKVNIQGLKKDKITHLSLVNAQLQMLLQEQAFQQVNLSIKHLLLGGSAFSEKLLQTTKKRGFTYHLSYGSTEMASQIATSTNSNDLKLLPYRLLKIVAGEIHLSGETRFTGYFTGDINNSLIDKNSYFASADLGKLKQKTVKIMGRKDRLFISGGENIQPEEIEKVLLGYAEVQQAVVLPIDDAIYGQRPIAFIRWKEAEQVRQLQAFIGDKLVSYKQPCHYFILPESQGIKPNLKDLTSIALKLLFVN